MSPTLTPPESRDCAAVGELLSWYANGTLGAADRADVDAHIESCTGCRATLALERRIVETMRAPRDNVEQSPHAGWQKMVARLDALEGLAPADETVGRETRAVPSVPVAGSSARTGRRRVNWPAALGAAVAVQAAAIAVLTVALVRHRQAEESQIYHTLANADPTLAVRGVLVRIAFDAGIDQANARSVAAQAGGRIAAGPSPENVYTFVFPKETAGGRTLDEKVSDLRRQAHVLLVEPVFLGEQSHTE
jgi:anti-sigma factor RsiW